MASVNVFLSDAGKKYTGQWVFRHLDLHLQQGDRLAVLGPNGSGKSTLLQVIAGAALLNEGTIRFSGDEPVDADTVFRHVSLAAPYLEPIEEFTLEESLKMHFGFKRIAGGMDLAAVAEASGLMASLHKPVKFFSSGMKQRLRLVLACLSDTPMLLLDEPCSNLDKDGVEWYAGLLDRYARGRTIVVCSNSHEEEFFMCTKTVRMTDYKNAARQPARRENV